MNVSCPECRSVFRVDPAKIPAGGVRARCSVCGGVITIGQSGAIEKVRDGRAAATPVARPVPRPQPPSPRAPTPSAPTPGVAPFGRNTPFGGSRTVTPHPAQGAPATPAQRPSAPTPPPARPSAPNVPGRGPTQMPAAPPPQPTPSSSSAPTPRAVPAPSAPAAPAAPTRSINPFLSNDPNVKAKRLARALVSDIVAYFPQKREEGLRNGTLKQLFREEIKKSYEEYVEQMGKEFAETTTHFQEALNEVLAGGKKLF
jgi:predicted Zn finger-like uncharacterized protein